MGRCEVDICRWMNEMVDDTQIKYPTMDAAAIVLRKLGVDPASRFDQYDQDFEYTACRVEELEAYLKLYQDEDTTLAEKRLLGCFLIEGLNDYVSLNHQSHPSQNEVFNRLHKDMNIHQDEFEYRFECWGMEGYEPWPICEYIMEWRKSQSWEKGS